MIGSQPQESAKGDILVGDSKPNVLVGMLGSDRISGRGARDELYGEGRPSDADLDLTYPAADRLHGGGGRDLLVGGIDSDVLDGGAAGDRILGESGPGFGGGEGRNAGSKDVVDYSSRKTRIRARTGKGGGARGENDRYSGIEGIRGGSGNDVLKGKRRRADVLFGGRGNDRLDGLTGKDVLRGERGRDYLKARDGRRDRVDCGKGRDRFRADRRDRVRRCELRR